MTVYYITLFPAIGSYLERQEKSRPYSAYRPLTVMISSWALRIINGLPLTKKRTRLPSKNDTKGTELGWFCVYTTDENIKTPILIVAEDVKNRGGSGYVVKKDKVILDNYLE